MDIQLIIVIVCIAAAAFYFGRRMIRALRKGQCGCCDGGCNDKKSGCACGCSAQDAEAQRLESRRLDFNSKNR